MITLNTKLTVGQDHMAHLPLPESVPNGEYDVVVIIDDKQKRSYSEIWSMKLNWVQESSTNYSRGEIYGDNGR